MTVAVYVTLILSAVFGKNTSTVILAENIKKFLIILDRLKKKIFFIRKN